MISGDDLNSYLEIARLCLKDAAVFDEMAQQLDVSDEEMIRLRQQLDDVLINCYLPRSAEVAQIPVGQAAELALLDGQRERIECGAVIAVQTMPATTMPARKISENGVPILACTDCDCQEFNLLLIEDEGEPLPIVACEKCGLKHGEFKEFEVES